MLAGPLTAALLVLALAGIAFATPQETGGMCPPVTIDDLFPEETTTSTTAPTTTSTTSVTSTTTTDTTTPPEGDVGTTTTTSAAPSTTTAPATTSTTVPATTSTTLPPEPPCDTPFVYPMHFPILGGGDPISGFGAPRDGGRRHHHGNDIAAVKLQPVVAVSDGTVSRIAGDSGISGYRIHILHDDGWQSLYIHLNNDTAGTDDSSGVGVRLDLEVGDRVQAGQIMGWNGDSGNAEGTTPHLHFELRDPDGEPVDPESSLASAARLPMDESFTGPFSDLDSSDDPDPLTLLLSRGVPVWCDDSAATACPGEEATARQLTPWFADLVGTVSLLAQPATGDEFDPATCAADGDCPELDEMTCPDCDQPLTEAEIARSLAWDRLRDAYQKGLGWLELGIPDSAWSTPPPRPPDHPSELSLEWTHQVLGGGLRCLDMPDPQRELTRMEAAELLVLYLGWTDNPQCPTSAWNR